MGQFDVLVGINLLREGLDLPEVSLMAILDADKEGFLRSDRSFDPDHWQGSAQCERDRHSLRRWDHGLMKRAMEETRRRRQLQSAFNKEHGITPQTVIRSIGSPLIRVYDADYVELPLAADKPGGYAPTELPRTIKRLKKEMKEAAQQLEIEKAAELRDRIRGLEQLELEFAMQPRRSNPNLLGSNCSGGSRCSPPPPILPRVRGEERVGALNRAKRLNCWNDWNARRELTAGTVGTA